MILRKSGQQQQWHENVKTAKKTNIWKLLNANMSKCINVETVKPQKIESGQMQKCINLETVKTQQCENRKNAKMWKHKNVKTQKCENGHNAKGENSQTQKKTESTKMWKQ